MSEKVQKAYEAGRTITPKPTVEPIRIQADRLALGTQTVIFGDSWTAGLFLRPETQGYAYLAADKLGLDAEVIGGSGTGYLNPGSAGLGTYNTRLKALPVSDARLLIIQGSVNDFGKNLLQLGPVFDQTIATAKKKFPKAQIVILGPSTNTMPIHAALSGADNIIGERAQNAGLAYISPMRGQWITSENFTKVISRDNSHPTVEGHAYLASKLVESINALKAG